MKKIVSITLICFIVLASIVGIKPMNMASAGQDEFIAPLFSGYMEDENKTILLSQNTLIDMSLYNGVGELGDDVGKVQAISTYMISNSEEGQAFYVPYLGTMDNLNKVEILLNGQAANIERLYGETPSYFAGDGQAMPVPMGRDRTCRTSRSASIANVLVGKGLAYVAVELQKN